MSWRRWIALALVGVAVAMAAQGCNTIRGIGRDIEQGGEALQDAAS
jgi:predicted small secreted protein